MRGQVAVAGIGQSHFYKKGRSPDAEFKMALDAILAACADAGISPSKIDGFSSFHNERNDPLRLAAALNLPELRFSCMQWGGGGGGTAGAIANAASGIVSGQASCVVVHRAIAQGQFNRYGQLELEANAARDVSHTAPYGMLSPAQMFAFVANRFEHEHGLGPELMQAIALTSYAHAQRNPRAIMYGRPLDAAAYEAARWISEPFGLYDCCLESDGGAALILVAADRAKDMPNPPCYLLAGGSSLVQRSSATVFNAPDFTSANFRQLANRLFQNAGVTPSDVDVLQSYENFTIGVALSIIECGFTTIDDAAEFLTPANLTLGGKLPLNTSGGNLAECYVHGLGLAVEAVRQIYGRSTAQVANADLSMVTAGPMVWPVSACLFGSAATL